MKRYVTVCRMRLQDIVVDRPNRRLGYVVDQTRSVPAQMIRETKSPRAMSEEALGRMWRMADTLPNGLESEDGRQFKIIYPGRPGGAAGPDFRDALIEGEFGERVTGDVEGPPVDAAAPACVPSEEPDAGRRQMTTRLSRPSGRSR
jgi:hypothetical protein